MSRAPTYEITRYITNDSDENEIEVTFLVDITGEYRRATRSDPEEYPEAEITGIVLTVESGSKSYNITLEDKNPLYKALIKEHREEVEMEASEEHGDKDDDDDDDDRDEDHRY